MFVEFLPHLYHPVAALYALQAVTYVKAATLSLHHGHRDLSVCYAFSAFLHIGVAVFLFFDLE
jgi:hypothetical protein